LFQQATLEVGEYKRISGFEPIKDIASSSAKNLLDEALAQIP
jgi:hypothetical protein